MIPLTVDNLLALAVQAAVLALAGAPLPWLFGIRSPRARLAYWRALLLACLLLPAIQPWAPRTFADLPVAAGMSERVSANDAFAPHAAAASIAAPAGWRVGVLDVVAAGIVARASWFAFGLVTLARVRRRAARLEPRPGSVVDAIGLAGADAEFRVSATPSRPVTFGVVRPVVVVPSDFAGFRDDEQKAIATHELIHVRRHDWVRNLGDEVVRAVAWFHPAAWWLTRQIRLAREQVVDQEVVGHLGARKPYLDALLRLASPDRGSVLVPAPLFLGRSHLADRVALLLKEVRMSRPRLALSFAAMAVFLLVTGRAVVAAFPLHADVAQPAVTQQASPGGQAQGTPKPGQVAPGRSGLAPAATRTKVKDVPPAFPAGSASIPVIAKGHINPSGDVTDTTCTAGPADLCEVAIKAVQQWRFSPAAGAALLVGFNPAAAGGALANQPPVLVGGNIRPPVKIQDKKPVYPADAQDAHVQGMVILDTVIAADGQVREARILRSVEKLDAAALDAVLGWKFQPQGFPVAMTVTVNFVLDDDKAAGVKGGVAGGVPGGVAGGVRGGVEGGVAGGVEGALRVGPGIKAPQKIVDVKAVYPKDAKDAGVQGVVIMEIAIGPDGKVKDAKILRSVPMLDEAALEAVRQWEFAPTLLNGVAQTVIMTVTVNFTLE